MENGTRKIFGLILATAALTALPAAAAAQEAQRSDTAATQDTSSMGRAQMDTKGQDSTQWGHDASQNPDVQNPPGYRGMERPVNVFPADSARQGQQEAGQVEDRVTGTYEDSAWRDTSGQQQNPAGYRGMERPAGLDTAQSGKQQGGASEQQELEQYRQRLGEMGYKVEKMSKSEKKAWKNRQSGTSQGASGADTTRGDTSGQSN